MAINMKAVLMAAKAEALPIEQQFLNDLVRCIEVEKQNDPYKPSKKYKPSSMQCIRNMYFQITGEELDSERPNASLVGINETGSFRHEIIQGYVYRMRATLGVDCEYVDVGDYIRNHKLTNIEIVKEANPEKGEYETRLYDKQLNISFLCDGIIRYKGFYFILEIKTETFHNFVGRKDVNPDHHAQATTYSLCLGLDKVIFIYEERDCCSKKSYLHVVTSCDRDNILALIKKCDDYVGHKIVPPRPKEVPKKACTYCKYKTACRREGK